jgi:hypothetical protein
MILYLSDTLSPILIKVTLSISKSTSYKFYGKIVSKLNTSMRLFLMLKNILTAQSLRKASNNAKIQESCLKNKALVLF